MTTINNDIYSKVDWKESRNLAMLCDFYEFTMANGFLECGKVDEIAYFDMFFREVPDNGGFAIVAGLKQFIDYIENMAFTPSDIEYFRRRLIFSDEFLSYLQNFNFACDVWAIPEGTPVFPHEPLLTVKGPIIQAQLIETMVLLSINHPSLIATKSNRIVRAAQGRPVLEFGSRRAQGYDGAIYGSRAAYIGGISSTSCTISHKYFGIHASGTMAHSWVQSFDSELESFLAYANSYPSSCVLLVDTYNVLKSGVPNAIKTFNDVVVTKGHRPVGIRLDSGDMAYLSKEARKMLDDAGFSDCKIIASNSLDEYIISSLINQQHAEIDMFGVGERLITSKSEPVFGGVYKLAAIEKNNIKVPKIKISENVAKITNPDFKEVYRLYDKTTNKAIADVITIKNEVINDDIPYEIFDPIHTWKRKIITNFNAVKLHVQIFNKGKLVYKSPNINEIRLYSEIELSKLWDEVKRMDNPQKYFVDLSQQLWNIKHELLEKYQ